MGGEGSMLSAIKTLKQNRALLKKRKLKNKADFITSERTPLSFKEVEATELEEIVLKIKKEKRKEYLFNLVIFLATLGIIIIIAIWAVKLKSHLF